VPVPPVTVCLPPLQAGPRPASGSNVVSVSKAQPWQSRGMVFVVGGSVMVQPKGAVVVMVVVQVRDSAQVVRVVVPGRVAGLLGQICDLC
jgi:hypothetical protein